MLPLAFLLLPLGPSALHFLGEPSCPNRTAVEAQLRSIAPGAFQSRAAHLAQLELQASGLEVRLFDVDGSLLEKRLLEGSKPCAEWARIAAALLATWEMDLAAPELALGHPPPATGPTVEAQVIPSLARGGPRVELGFGAGGAGAGSDSFALGGRLLVGVQATAKPFGAQLALDATTLRSVSVGTGSAQWQRTAVSLGGYASFGTGPWKLELGAALLGGVLTASGNDLPNARRSSTLEAGLEVSPRLRWDFAHDCLLWLQLGGALWFDSQSAQVVVGNATVSSAPIPSFDATAIVGISFLVDL